MTHFFEKRDLWGNRYSLWVVVLMAFVAPVCAWSMRQIRLDGNVEKWLPDNDPENQTLRWALDCFPNEERVLLTWDGSSINDPRVLKLVEQLAGKPDAQGIKRGGLPYVGTVIEPRQALEVMQRNGIEPHEAVRRLEGTILGAGPLRLRLTETGRSAMRKTKRELQTAMRARFGLDLAILDASPDLTPLVAIPGFADENGTIGDPAAPTILTADGKMATDSTVEHDLQVAWKGMRIGSESTATIANWLANYVPERGDGKTLVGSSFFAPGSPVALAIGISEAGMADKAETLSAIRSACTLAGIPGESVHMSGIAVSATELNQQVNHAVWDRSFPMNQIHRRSVILSSLVVIALLSYVFLRSIRLATMVLFVSLFAMACSMSIIPMTGGTINMVMIVLPTLLIALSISSSIYVISEWKRAAYLNESTAIVESRQQLWRPCLFASLTSAIGFISLCTSRLTPIHDFGFYAAVGSLVSLLVVMYGLPSLMQLWRCRRPKEHELEHDGWRFFGRMLTIHSGWQSLAMIAICIGCGIGLNRIRTETKLIRYFPDNARIAQDFWWIETSLAGVMPVETVIRFDQQSQKDTNFLDRMEIVRQVQDQIRIHPEISGSTSLADFEPVTERPGDDSGFLQKTKYNKRAASVHQRVRDGEIPAAKSFYTVAERRNDLDEPGDGKLNQAGDELWRITAHVNVMTDNDFDLVLSDLHRITQDVLKLQPGSNHVIAGTVPIFVKTQQEITKSLSGSLILAAALILGVFVFMLRSVAAGVVAMIPNVLSITAVLGALSWAGQRIDIGSIIAASLALGMTVHGTIHFLSCVQSALRKGSTRRDAVVDALARCGPAIWQASAVVALGMLALVPAELLLISRFGGLMAAMIGAAFIGNVVLLPQLIGGPLGWLFQPALPKTTTPSLNVQLESPLVEHAVTTISNDVPIPSPHIKPHVPAVKKRRSGPRRDPEAG